MAHAFNRHRLWLLVVLGVAVLATHGFALRYALSHQAVSAAVGGGILALLAIKHAGLVGLIYRRLAKARPGKDPR